MEEIIQVVMWREGRREGVESSVNYIAEERQKER